MHLINFLVVWVAKDKQRMSSGHLHDMFGQKIWTVSSELYWHAPLAADVDFPTLHASGKIVSSQPAFQSVMKIGTKAK